MACAVVPDNQEDFVDEELQTNPPKVLNTSPGALKLRSWLNKSLRIQMFDGRVLVGVFLCTDRDANIILGSCTENTESDTVEEPRMLGLVMVPGKHIQSVALDQNHAESEMCTGLTKDTNPEEVT